MKRSINTATVIERTFDVLNNYSISFKVVFDTPYCDVLHIEINNNIMYYFINVFFPKYIITLQCSTMG